MATNPKIAAMMDPILNFLKCSRVIEVRPADSERVQTKPQRPISVEKYLVASILLPDFYNCSNTDAGRCTDVSIIGDRSLPGIEHIQNIPL